MRRQPKHLMDFIFAELGTSGSVDGAQRLMIKGRYTQKNMENVLKKYIGEFTKALRSSVVSRLTYCNEVEYVMCKTCKSSDTILDKENRLYFIVCEACGSSKSRVLPFATFNVLIQCFSQSDPSRQSRPVSRLRSEGERQWRRKRNRRDHATCFVYHREHALSPLYCMTFARHWLRH